LPNIFVNAQLISGWFRISIGYHSPCLKNILIRSL